MRAGTLTDAIKAAGIPIEGVSMGRRADKSTWEVQFAKDATPQQQADAAAILAAFDPTAPTRREEIAARLAELRALTSDKWTLSECVECSQLLIEERGL